MNTAIRNVVITLLLLIVLACMIGIANKPNKPHPELSSPKRIAVVIFVAVGTIVLLTQTRVRH